MDQAEHEESLIKAFVVAQKHDRMLEMLANPKKRRKVLQTLYHFHDLDERFIVPILSHLQTPAGIAEALRRYGAPEECWVISSDDLRDARELPLDEVLAAIIGYGHGSLLSCVPGTLAFFEGEGQNDCCILRRAPS